MPRKSAAHHIWRLEKAMGVPIITKGLPLAESALMWYGRYRLAAALAGGLRRYRAARRQRRQ